MGCIRLGRHCERRSPCFFISIDHFCSQRGCRCALELSQGLRSIDEPAAALSKRTQLTAYEAEGSEFLWTCWIHCMKSSQRYLHVHASEAHDPRVADLCVLCLPCAYLCHVSALDSHPVSTLSYPMSLALECQCTAVVRDKLVEEDGNVGKNVI